MKSRAAVLGGSIGTLWFVRIVDMLVPGPGSLAGHGVIPRTWIGLQGIPFAPFIHADVAHLAANTIPFLILGALVLLGSVREFVFVCVTAALVSGLGTWLFGAGGTMHVGASGVVFGLFGYLVSRAIFDPRLSSIAITVLVAVLYGAAMVSSLVPAEGISWTAHVFGFIGGVMAARMARAR